MITISVATQFSITPGARLRRDGTNSGQEFREVFLEPHFAVSSDEIITINLDGVEGYSTAFLEEAFGGLARRFDQETILKRIKFISEDEPLLITEIEKYIRNARAK